MAEIEITAPCFLRGGIKLFRHADALYALDQLSRAGAVILGADQFNVLESGSIQPVDDIDVSGDNYIGDPYSDVREFITARPSDPATAYELVWN